MQLSVQIAEEIIKQAEQGKSWRRNSEVHQNSQNIVEAAGFGAVPSAPWVRGKCSWEPSDGSCGCRAGQDRVVCPGAHVTPAGAATPVTGMPRTVPCPSQAEFSCPRCLLHLAGAEGSLSVGSLLSPVQLELLCPQPKPDCSESSGEGLGKAGCFC